MLGLFGVPYWCGQEHKPEGIARPDMEGEKEVGEEREADIPSENATKGKLLGVSPLGLLGRGCFRNQLNIFSREG